MAGKVRVVEEIANRCSLRVEPTSIRPQTIPAIMQMAGNRKCFVLSILGLVG